MTRLLVEFIFPATEHEASVPAPVPAAVLKQLCQSCGADAFTLVNEIKANTVKGMPASRMFECIACGKYQLG